ncbi:hypothetical protein SVEN_6936 [Streptomyces venezuelae ATCC 10712]|uniref:Uncharacterized protein n=1 Tax=Streptomyces venezuelae (strain ATCC 10712 / CBS 650.69 / DSM 40230 / JCM 4526 / NBRC 13096 / PD 04745) TaxID=953739 RepID=F2RK66_STRVP|nr:hypothetical protein SVEN_6936 [Streptomyces venezuelae ATCC 10712]
MRPVRLRAARPARPPGPPPYGEHAEAHEADRRDHPHRREEPEGHGGRGGDGQDEQGHAGGAEAGGAPAEAVPPHHAPRAARPRVGVPEGVQLAAERFIAPKAGLDAFEELPFLVGELGIVHHELPSSVERSGHRSRHAQGRPETVPVCREPCVEVLEGGVEDRDGVAVPGFGEVLLAVRAVLEHASRLVGARESPCTPFVRSAGPGAHRTP